MKYALFILQKDEPSQPGVGMYILFTIIIILDSSNTIKVSR